MATIAPPPSKRQKRAVLERSQIQQDVTVIAPGQDGSFKARFLDGDGKQMADVIEVPLADASEKNLSLLLNTLLAREREEFLPYRFRIHIPGSDIIVDQYPTDLLALLRSHGIENPFETTVTLSAEPQAVFKVQAVTRMSHRMPGHGEAILAAQFSPKNSNRLVTGSGDKTARIWDTDTGTPKFTLSGHSHWVLCVAWSPDGERVATGSMDKTVRIWNPETGKAVGNPLTGHSKWVTNIAWEPYHLWTDGTPRLASASKDATIRLWAVNTGRVEHILSGHKGSVSCVRWGGTGLIYSASHDKTIRVWSAEKGTLVHTLSSHTHWVNHLALSTDFVLRTGFYDHTPVPDTDEGKVAKAKERFEKAAKIQGRVAERLVSASDDFTMYLWDPSQGTKPVARMLGHQKQVNHVTFSPDGSLIASAGWDNHTKVWNARDGKFIDTLRGHVAPVYQCSFSADSRLLVTASKDTTLKVWSMPSYVSPFPVADSSGGGYPGLGAPAENGTGRLRMGTEARPNLQKLQPTRRRCEDEKIWKPRRSSSFIGVEPRRFQRDVLIIIWEWMGGHVAEKLVLRCNCASLAGAAMNMYMQVSHLDLKNQRQIMTLVVVVFIIVEAVAGRLGNGRNIAVSFGRAADLWMSGLGYETISRPRKLAHWASYRGTYSADAGDAAGWSSPQHFLGNPPAPRDQLARPSARAVYQPPFCIPSGSSQRHAPPRRPARVQGPANEMHSPALGTGEGLELRGISW
ncbi:hypothetical protein G7046_g5410 [Stylonectria norvegica]|nr:hypothetical protein G7046_g5410 [Stylonectria norvegica]